MERLNPQASEFSSTASCLPQVTEWDENRFVMLFRLYLFLYSPPKFRSVVVSVGCLIGFGVSLTCSHVMSHLFTSHHHRFFCLNRCQSKKHAHTTHHPKNYCMLLFSCVWKLN